MAKKYKPELSVQKYIGLVFGYYTVISYSHHLRRPSGWRGEAYVNVQCKCGTVNKVSIQQLKKGQVKSCGCYRLEKEAEYRPQANLNLILSQHINSAKERQIPWKIKDGEAFELFRQPCYYCKGMNTRKRKFHTKTREIKLNGIDRKDNNIGYELGNCVPCCHPCNRSKNDSTIAEFEVWVKTLEERLPAIHKLLYKTHNIDTSML